MTYLRFTGARVLFAWPATPDLALGVVGTLLPGRGGPPTPLRRVLMARVRYGDDWPDVPLERAREAIAFAQSWEALDRPQHYIERDFFDVEFKLTGERWLLAHLERFYYARVIGREEELRLPAHAWAREAPLVRIEPLP